MAKEIERKFLLKNDSWRNLATEKFHISQGYIYFNGGIVRIRIQEDKAFLTLKTRTIGITREEFEYPIPLDDAKVLLHNVCEKTHIEKTRFKINASDHVWEIDEFHGSSSGLVLAELELRSSSEKFKRPAWLGREVSHDPKYYNSNLAKKAFSEWNPIDRLESFRPQDYSPVLRVKLNPDAPVGKELKKVYSRLLWIAEKNEKGIIDDIDPDFLHDYRVAIRKTRSLLGLLKKVYPKTTNLEFRKDFALIAQHTNYLRDLDVFLLRFKAYLSEIPKALQPQLLPLLTELQKERKIESDKTSKFLPSGNYKDLKKRWRKFLANTGKHNDAPDYHKPVLQIAVEKLKKSHARLIKTGCELTNTSPAKEFHALRIKCKKFRYLLEVFSSLFDQESVSSFSKQLKSLQDNLGAANDLSFQISVIKQFTEKTMETGHNQSVNALIVLLEDKIKKLRNEYQQVFTQFANKKISGLLKSQ